MKKLILFFVIMMMIVATATAFSMPHPIYGKVTSEGFAVQGVSMRVTNTDTAATSKTTTNNGGFYQVDLGNIDSRYQGGDNIKVSLVFCETDSRCYKTVEVTGGGNQVTFDIAEENLPDDATVVKYVCWDKSVASTSSECPAKFICWDNSEVTNESECPEEDSTTLALSILGGILSIALLIIGKFKWGKGFVGLANYYKRLGDEAKARGDNAQAEKNYMRAAKMVSTAISRAKDGTYY